MRNKLVCVLVALLALVSTVGCVSNTPLDELNPEQIARRERVVYLAAKASAAKVVEEGIAKPADLERAAAIVESAATDDLVGAFVAAGLTGPEWELLALLVEERLEPYRFSPLALGMVAAAARGVRDGAAGMSRDERSELQTLET